MIQVLLLKEYQGHVKGDIISVSKNVAFGLEEKDVARRTSPSDFVKKTEMGTTKAFNSPPSKSRKKNFDGKIQRSQ